MTTPIAPNINQKLAPCRACGAACTQLHAYVSVSVIYNGPQPAEITLLATRVLPELEVRRTEKGACSLDPGVKVTETNLFLKLQHKMNRICKNFTI
jgi:hypothetical protein